MIWFCTDCNIRYRPFVIRHTVILQFGNSYYTGSFGILKIIYFSGITAVLGSRFRSHIIRITYFRKFYRGGVLPELVILAETGTAARRESPRIIPGSHVFKLRNLINNSSLRFNFDCNMTKPRLTLYKKRPPKRSIS